MAANTDKLRKKKSNFSTTLSSSITDSDTTIPLSSASGLPTDTAITLTIDRVDANGTSTPTKVERVTGVISGNNLTNALRGQDGTSAAAHDSAAVVEDIWDADTWNDAIDAILASHDQDGGHKANAIDAITEIKSTLKTGSDTKLVTGTTGTDGYTAKWNADGDLVDGYEVLDEDDMSSNSDTKLATQQSIKKYVDDEIDTAISGVNTHSLTFVIDGGGDVIETGAKGMLVIPFDCTITKASIVSEISGSIVVDIWVDDSSHLPTDGDSITASAPLTLSSAYFAYDTTLTGWTKDLNANDLMRFNVDSCSTIERVTISLLVTRT